MKWTLEICQKAALKYEYRSDFKKLDNLAYNACVKNKYLNIVCSHMKYKINTPGHWTHNKCQEAALSCRKIYIKRIS